MNKHILLFLGVLASTFLLCSGGEPFKAYPKSIPFLVYYTSRYRGICEGTLVGRAVVLTALVCVCNPRSTTTDTRPINVVVGSMYRHARRGIRVQVTRIISPKLPSDISHRAYVLEKSPAILLLKKKVPDILTEVPPRALEVSYKEDLELRLQEECLLTGWHFFYKGDKIYPGYKFLLHRNLRAQFVNIVKMHEWCDALHIKLIKSMSNIGYDDPLDPKSMLCVKDPDDRAQACHGMYGAPFICQGRAVGMLMAPDAQWTNCTGFSNIIHMFNSPRLQNFFNCVGRLFVTETKLDWNLMKKALYMEAEDVYDYIPAIYDKLIFKSGETSDEDR
ncbi:hypothetical protein O0L34_g2262 [Tuta absoluta]|nr:hypothetical protein O0L34_g2262 [Tuta absoluta]